MKLAEGKLFESGGTRVAACSEVLNLSAFFIVRWLGYRPARGKPAHGKPADGKPADGKPARANVVQYA